MRKVSSTGPDSTVVFVFVYDTAGHLLGEYDQHGAALREYVWLRDTPMAMFTPDPANPSGEPLVYFIHTDHLNTPRVVVDRQNRVRWRWLAEPFGTSAPETNPSGLGVFTQNLRFPGQYADQESGCSTTTIATMDQAKVATRKVIQSGWRVGVFRHMGMSAEIRSVLWMLKGFN